MLLVEISRKAFPPKQLASSGLYMGFKLWGKKQQQQQKQGPQISNFMVVWTTETMRLSQGKNVAMTRRLPYTQK